MTNKLLTILGVAMLSGVVTPAFAESAPVFDADSMGQSADSGYEQNQPDVLPPSPTPDSGGTFVPADSMSPSRASSGGGSMDSRMKRLEQQVTTMQNSDSAQRMESMQTQLQSLHGQVEQLTHQVQQMQEQQKAMFSDIDRRLSQKKLNDEASAGAEASSAKSVKKSALAKTNNKSDDGAAGVSAAAASIGAGTVAADTAASKTETTAAAATTDQPNVAEEQQIYQTAYTLIKAKKYNEAVDVLQGMLTKYPSGQFASNAHYWLGELYGLMGKNDQALTEFGVVVKKYPDSPRVSDAQLKLGMILAAESKWPDAKIALKNVINHYPGTASSRLASEQLKQIKQAGH